MPNPHLTFCPACGAPGLAHDPKKAQCPSCQLELYFNPGTAVCALILNHRNELLVVIRAHEPKQGMWDLPGGFVDPGETAEDAIRREVQEELNVAIENITYLCSAANNHYTYKGITYQTTDLAFAGTVKEPDGIEARDDIQDYKWVALEDIDLAKFGFDSIRQIVKRYMTTVSD
jgi:NAD+ diphosphatase